MNKHALFFPKKSLGQNFLVNPNIVQRIITSCDLKPTDIVLEIGPGKGALTHGLSQQVKSIVAIEKDQLLADQLKKDFANTNVHIVHADILNHPFQKLPGSIKVIGNLPYNVVTPIIEKILDHRKKFCTFYLTVQLEYGQRLAAQPNSKSYGSFSCFVQYYADPKILFKISNSAFRPIPKVQSCFLRLNLLKKPKFKASNEDFLFKVIRACFGQRRKTIQNSLSGVMTDRKKIPCLLEALNIDPKLRAENLSLEDYVRICNLVDAEKSGGRQGSL